MVRGNYSVESVTTQEIGSEKVVVVVLVSGFSANGPTFNDAVSKAKAKEWEYYAQVVDSTPELRGIYPERSEKGNSVTFKFYNTKSIKANSTGSSSDIELYLPQAYNASVKATEEAKAAKANKKPSAINANEGGKYGSILSGYVKRLPGVHAFEVIPGGNVRCHLKDGRVADSVRGRNDKFDVHIGTLWAYINATNSSSPEKNSKPTVDDIIAMVSEDVKRSHAGYAEGKSFPSLSEFSKCLSKETRGAMFGCSTEDVDDLMTSNIEEAIEFLSNRL